MIKINGTTIKTPQRCTIGIVDVASKSDRNALGETLIDRIAVKRRLDMEWGALTNAEISSILTAVYDVFFDIEYPDPQTGTTRTIVAYMDSREAPVLKYSGSTPFWEGLRISLMER